MIESYKHISENQKEIIESYLGAGTRFISRGDTLIFKADFIQNGLDMNTIESMETALSKIFPNQNIVILPISMDIEILKEV